MSDIAIYKSTWPSLLGQTVLNTLVNDGLDRWVQQTTSGYPVADIYGTDDGDTVLEFALAGFSKSDLSIDVRPEKNTITVSGNPEVKNGDTRRIARRSFVKSYVNYDSNLDIKSTTARFENGLLTITVPKKPERKPVAIKID